MAWSFRFISCFVLLVVIGISDLRASTLGAKDEVFYGNWYYRHTVGTVGYDLDNFEDGNPTGVKLTGEYDFNTGVGSILVSFPDSGLNQSYVIKSLYSGSSYVIQLPFSTYRLYDHFLNCYVVCDDAFPRTHTVHTLNVGQSGFWPRGFKMTLRANDWGFSGPDSYTSGPCPGINSGADCLQFVNARADISAIPVPAPITLLLLSLVPLWFVGLNRRKILTEASV